MAEESLCPYCGHRFDNPLVRKKKCPACGNAIVIRQGQPVTEAAAKEHDYIRAWLGKLASLEIDRDGFHSARDSLSERFGQRASVNDTVWSLLNRVAGNPRADRATAYLLMAEVVEGENKDTAPYVEQAKKVRAQENDRRAAQWRAEIREQVDTSRVIGIGFHVRVQTCNDNLVCISCREASSRPYTLQEALDRLPDLAKCENLESGCRCSLGFALDV